MVGLLVTLLLGSVPGLARSQPFECAAGCTDRGNCNPDDGRCICPYGYTGKACEVDALSACRITPDGPAICHSRTTMSCECHRQCEKFHCQGDVCAPPLPPKGRGCYMRDGVPPEKQLSKPPEEGEAGVKYFLGWKLGAPEASSSQEIAKAMRFESVETVPSSKCPKGCSELGHCIKYWEDAESKPFCACHRSEVGTACEVQETKWCLLNCTGRGTCRDLFCHCKPGSFSLGCSRNRSVPATSRPNPASFKIYMYDLNTQYMYPPHRGLGESRPEDGTQMYSAYLLFLEQFLTSPVRTEDPSEASLFFIPAFLFSYTGASMDGNEHLSLLLDHVNKTYPYWGRHGGVDHFFFAPADRGSCHLKGLAQQAIKLTHFGYYNVHPKNSTMATIQSLGTEGYSCYHPQRDVVTVPQDRRHKEWAARSSAQAVDEIIKGKTKLLFFHGGTLIGRDAPEFSGNSRQILDELDQTWKDPDFEFLTKERFPDFFAFANDLDEYYRRSNFCFIPYGWGWGNRLGQAMVCNCVPVVVQERVFQPYEDVLPYETFSIRLTNADLPRLREILRGITGQQYRGMIEQLVRYRNAFHWYPQSGGRAFDYTIASLRRRYMNLKALY